MALTNVGVLFGKCEFCLQGSQKWLTHMNLLNPKNHILHYFHFMVHVGGNAFTI